MSTDNTGTRSLRVKDVEYKLDRDFTREEFYGQFGDGATFPQVVLNHENLGGAQESIRYMQDNEICCMV